MAFLASLCQRRQLATALGRFGRPADRTVFALIQTEILKPKRENG